MPDRLDRLSPEQRAKLAKILAAKKRGRQKRDMVITPRPQRDVYPLSLQQEQLWLIDQLEPGNPAYNIHTAVRIVGPLAAALLQESFRRVLARHEALRAYFDASDGRPYQQVKDDVALEIALIDLRDHSPETQQSELRRISDEMAAIRFQLHQPPLMRAALVRLRQHEHIFLLTMHHIIIDGWSMGVLVQELLNIYQSLAAGQEPEPFASPIQYADYAWWQRQWLQSEDFQHQLAFWRRQMTPPPLPLQLPTDFPRPAMQRFDGLHHEFIIPKALVGRLQTLARDQNATLFSVLLAGYKILLARYTGQRDIVVGAPIANRPFRELETMLGYFVNPLPLRTDLSGDPSFSELLHRERDANQAAFENQSLPFETLVQAVQPQRSMAHSPLFQTLFTLQNLHRKLKARDVYFEPLFLESGTVKFDLTLTIEEDAQGLRCWLGYRTDLFHPDAIHRMGRHFVNLLADAVTHPQKRLSELTLLDDDDRAALTHLAIAASHHPPATPDAAIVDLFQAQVAAAPESVAIIAPDERLQQAPRTLTYAQLDARANQLAYALIDRGLGPESRIGLMLPRSPELIIALLGILKAGGVYVPLDPNYPEERLRYMIKDADVALVITESDAGVDDVLTIDLQSLLSNQPTTAPATIIHPENAAYIIYTSGTTGRPKGVVATHRGLSNYIQHAARSFELTPDDRVLQFSSISFDAAAEEIYPTLISGAALVLRTDAMIGSARSFIDASAALGVTVWDMATAFFHQLIGEMEETDLPAPDTLRLIVFGGEKVQPALLRQWFHRVGRRVRLLNTYGPTETTIVVTESEITPDKLHDALPAPIGRPVSETQAWVVDENGRLAPRGVVGELLIAGAGVARGYRNRPALTAERFIPNPFAPADDASASEAAAFHHHLHSPNRLYRTGDLVRWNIHGELEFHGRADHQVKVRGFRIELGGIEARLLAHPQVKEALVHVFPRPDGDNRLVAYVTCEDESPTVADLHAFLKHALPDYMIPTHFFVLEAFPTTAAGKVDLRALPSPDGHRPDLGVAFTPPRDALEEKLAALWARVLDVEQIGVHDNFFELGGDSLRAAIVINRLQAALDVVIYAVALFDAPTIAQLADYLRQRFPREVAIWVGDETGGADAGASAIPPARAITPADIAHFQQLVHSHTHFVSPPDVSEPEPLPANPPAAFILTSPRSGSTLLRVMLAGNPALFSPPELALLSYRSMGERARALSGRDAGWNEGLLRALMELFGWGLEEAKAHLARFESQDLPTQTFYRHLQDALGGRMLVDKTTTYATDLRVLRRSQSWFRDARFIHLVRNPNAAIQSYIDSNINQVFGHDLPLSERENAERFWLLTNQNILTFLQDIPAERQLFLHFEDLVKHPRPVMESLCDFLDVPFDEEMLYPYRGDKMTSPVHPESRMVGDPRFHKHHTIEAEMADKWRQPQSDILSPITWELGRRLGYDLPMPEPAHVAIRMPIRAQPPATPRLLSFSQQRLWFLDHMEPGSPLYNIASAVRVSGRLDVSAFEAALNAILQRHEMLRTTFHTVDGKPQLIIHPHLSLRVQVEDLRHIEMAQRLQTAHEHARTLAQQPFDLAQGPLLRVALYRLADDEHLAALVVHHIAADGWSFPILLRELAAYYGAQQSGEKLQLPPLPIQYTDFAAWQRAWLETKDAAWQIAYWKEQLSASPSFLDLPTDHPRPPVQTYRGQQMRFDLDESLVARLETLARNEDATLFMALLAGFHALLHRYSGQESINIGIPIANRSRPEIEDLIGFFVNTLVLRADFGRDITFQQLLAQVRERAMAAYAHQDAPFELVVDAVQPERDPSYSPLFQVMFAYQDAPPERVALPDFTLEPLHLDMGIAKFDLSLSAVRREGRVEAVFEYNTDLFEASSIRRLIGHFRTLLENAIAEPHRSLHVLPMLTPAEIAQLRAWNDTAQDMDAPALLTGFLHRNVRAQPHALAARAVDGLGRGVELTFAELEARSNQLAHYLLSLNLPPETPVGAMLPKSVDVPIAILGIMKAGLVYLPLDPNYPEDRLRFMLEDSQAALVIKNRAIAIEAETLGVDPASILDLSAVIASQPHTPPAIAIDPQNAAYIIYTSGSTGRPKGVVAHHRGVVNFILGFQQAYHLTRDDRLLQFASLNFDASIADIFLAQAGGGALLFGPPEIYTSAERLLQFLRQERISIAILPPSLLAALPQSDLPDLRTLVTAGEACTWDVVRRWAAGRRFFNAYGPTEASVGVSNHLLRPEDENDRAAPIGKPIPNITFHVLDAYQQPLPVGVPGELYIGGVGVTRGYLKRPALTAERFLPNPFVADIGQQAQDDDGASSRMYRSGDLVRWLPDGALEFLGRVDHQVKIRGYRIELGEIERQLDAHPGVQKSAVVLQTTGAVKRLAAFFVAQDKTPPAAGELQAFLSRFLPDYMIPAHFVALDALPLSPSGKVDRRELTRRSLTLARADDEQHVLPRDEREATLARIWAELLGLDEVSVEDNFFELGGDSILTIQMISRAADAGVIITAKQLFQYPTIAGLAAVAAKGRRIMAEQDEVTGVAPLTPIQRWFFQQRFAHPQHWNQAILLDVGQPLDADLLRQAVDALLRHHDALRLRFYQDETGAWVQDNAGVSPETPFETIDLSHTPAEALAQAITTHSTHIQGALNLTQGPLFRAAYFQLGEARGWRLLLVAHHLVIDGVSWRILTEDLQRAYLQLSNGQAVSLPRKSTAFIHWARVLADNARTADLSDELAFWREAASAPNPRLPLHSSPEREGNTESMTRTEVLHFDPDLTKALRQGLPAAVDADMQTALLTALAWAMREWTGEARFKLSMEGHGRDLDLPGVDITRTVGWFTTLYPLALNITGAADAIEALGQVRQTLRQLPDNGVSYGILRYLHEEDGLAADDPIISFNYLGHFESGEQGGFRPASEDKGPERHPANQRPHLLDITASIVEDALTVNFTFTESLLMHHHLQRLAMAFHQAVLSLHAHLHDFASDDEIGLETEILDDLLDELEF